MSATSEKKDSILCVELTLFMSFSSIYMRLVQNRVLVSPCRLKAFYYSTTVYEKRMRAECPIIRYLGFCGVLQIIIPNLIIAIALVLSHASLSCVLI